MLVRVILVFPDCRPAKIEDGRRREGGINGTAIQIIYNWTKIASATRADALDLRFQFESWMC